MKKFLSILLCAVMLTGILVMPGTAADNDKVLVFDDLRFDNVGTIGYAGFSPDYSKDEEGITVAFDFQAIDYGPCTHQFDKPNYKHLCAATLLIGGGCNLVYDFETKSFGLYQIGWPSGGADFADGYDIKWAEGEYECKPGEWHRVVLNIWDVDVQVYVDGELVCEHSYLGGDEGTIDHTYILWWSQHCRFAIDNFVVAKPDPSDYDFFNEDFGSDAIYYFEDFNDLESIVVTSTEEVQDEDEYGNGKVDDKGNPIMKTVYNTTGKMQRDEDSISYWGETWAGKYTENGEQKYGDPYSVMERGESFLDIPENENADISFADTEGKKDKEITVEVTAGANADGEYTLKLDRFLSFVRVDNVAAGSTVNVNGDKVTISGAKAGKLCDFVLKTDPLCKQDDKYRYGFGAADGKVVDGGAVAITNFKYGDCNDDGSVNNKDIATMLKVHSKWDPSKFTWIPEAADVYADGLFGARDIQHLMRHLAGWGGIYAYIPSSAAPADVK